MASTSRSLLKKALVVKKQQVQAQNLQRNVTPFGILTTLTASTSESINFKIMNDVSVFLLTSQALELPLPPGYYIHSDSLQPPDLSKLTKKDYFILF
jgi:hypothetical protein